MHQAWVSYGGEEGRNAIHRSPQGKETNKIAENHSAEEENIWNDDGRRRIPSTTEYNLERSGLIGLGKQHGLNF